MKEEARRAAQPTRVGLLGLGVIGAVHASVLTGLDGFDMVFTVDPDIERKPSAPDVPHFDTLELAVRAGTDADLIVVATPTPSHLDLVAQVLTTTSADVLSEKPLAEDLQKLAAFESRHASDLDRVRVVNHFAFSPEVEWAVRVVGREQWGAPEHALCTFNDPYATKTADERRTYVSSWVDSGSNQLSMLARFARGFQVVAHEADAADMRAATSVRYDGGSATLISNWHTGDSSKQTRLRWTGDRELILDHTAMTGYHLERGRLVEHVGHDGTTGRKVAHYRAMYRALVGDPLMYPFSLELARRVVEQLTAATVARSTAGVRWTCASVQVPELPRSDG